MKDDEPEEHEKRKEKKSALGFIGKDFFYSFAGDYRYSQDRQKNDPVSP
jgi:hypothetical protein